jgi:solute carrier family 36 (proton-coupled amino acid transporter)
MIGVSGMLPAMSCPRRARSLLTSVTGTTQVLFACAGVLSYAAYGSHIQTVVISNLPQEHKFVQVVQVSLSFPRSAL